MEKYHLGAQRRGIKGVKELMPCTFEVLYITELFCLSILLAKISSFFCYTQFAACQIYVIIFCLFFVFLFKQCLFLV